MLGTALDVYNVVGLTPRVFITRGRQRGMRIGTADHAEFVRIDAQFFDRGWPDSGVVSLRGLYYDKSWKLICRSAHIGRRQGAVRMTYDTFLRSPLICTGSQSPMAKIEHWGIAALLLVATVNNASAQEQEHNLPATAAQTYVQAWLGTMEADNAWSLDDPSTGVRLEADYSSIPLGGGVSQLLWGASVQIGFEGGGS